VKEESKVTKDQRSKLEKARVVALADSVTSGDSWHECVEEAVEEFVTRVVGGEIRRFSELTDDELLVVCKDQCGYNREAIDYSKGDEGELKYQTALGAVIQEIEEGSTCKSINLNQEMGN
jgi:hypothetical protein